MFYTANEKLIKNNKGALKMKKNSRNTLILGTATLLAGVAATNTLDAANNTQNTIEKTTQSVSYTADGKTDIKTARLFKQLMQNNRNLQIHAEVIKQPARQNKPHKEVDINYTITGKTDMKTVKKLIKLINNSKAIEISMIANTGSQTAKQKRQQKEYMPKQNLHNGSANAYVYNYPQPYYYGYNTVYSGYNIYPPLYVQGNIIWYPVPVLDSYVNNDVVNKQTSASITVASN